MRPTSALPPFMCRLAVPAVAFSMFAFAPSNPAHAVPSFAAQTGQACQMCHIGALGPQLTPYGRNFKMKGYTLQGGEGLASQVHLALWVQSGFTATNKDLPQDAAPHYNTNDNAGVQAISLFYSGRITDHVGVFLQATYDNVAKALAQDNSDVRIIGDTTVFGKDVDYGVSINNAPGWSDPYNSNYLWGYPYIGSFLAVGPNAAPILAGAEGDNSLGVIGYAWVDQHIYVDLGGYETQAPGMMKLLGEAYGAGSATGIEPYTSLTYAWFWGNSNAHLGGTFFNGRYNPTDPNSKGFTADGRFGHDSYYDFLLHGGYQYIGDDNIHVFTVDSWYDYEIQHLEGTSNPFNPNVGSSMPNNHLEDFNIATTYYYKETYGGNVKFEKTWGNKNQLLYNTGANDGSGSINGSPESTSITLEADWVPFGKEDSWLRPFINLKLGLQYTIYTQFNGASHNYDGYGRNAADNNTLFLFAWTVF
jgi:hypothetical protein